MAGFSTTSGGLNFQYPNRDTQNWDSVMANSFTTISSHDHSRDTAGRGAVLTDRSILANNAGWLQSKDFAGTGTVNLIRANTSNLLELGGSLINLTITSAANVGSLVVTSAASVGGLTTLTGGAQLGANLDVKTHSITTTTVNGDVTLTPNGTGGVVAGPITLPKADGTSGQVMATNGAGQVSFINQGKLLQISQSISNSGATTTAVIPVDNTIPQITEGTQLLTIDFTPKSATSTLQIEFMCNYFSHSTAGNTIVIALFVDSTANALTATMTDSLDSSNAIVTGRLLHTVAAGSTSTRTYRLRFGTGSTGTARALTGSAGQFFGGVEAMRLTVKEFEAS